VSEYVRKTEAELARLSDEQLLAWIGVARDAGDLDAAKRGSGMLAFRHAKRVTDKVKVRTPPESVEDVVMNVMESAIRSAFDGKFMGEFGSWINTITRRRIADFHEARKRLPDTTLLPDEHEGDEGVWVSIGIEEVDIAMVGYREIADRLCAQRNEVHRAVIKLYGPVEIGYLEYDAASTADEVNRLFPDARMTAQNVYKIWSRFQQDFADALEDSDFEGEQP
jgi:DNA-directed RNA polymerase specialized sigma24 family protein